MGLKSVLKDKDNIYISATKPNTGHALGASSAMEVAISCMVMKNNWLHPIMNLHQPIDENINFVQHSGLKKNIDWAMSLSYGFGGHMGGVLLSG